ncbi:MAG: hypothetical protein WBF87_10540 [Mesorhizobium sp.]
MRLVAHTALSAVMWIENWRFVLPVGAACLLWPAEALAHASDRGFVLLLPTGHYIVGGAIAVAASFLALVLSPPSLGQVWRARLTLFALPVDLRVATSLLSLALLAVLVIAGITGSRDPLSNPLPLVVWTLFWVGLTLLIGIFGNIFRWLDPWYGLCALFGRAGEGDPRSTSRDWSFLPAIVQFAAFAWFELVYPAPDDPYRLAVAVSVYWLVNLVAALVVGHRRWSRTGECFSVFFRIVSRLSVIDLRKDGRLTLCLPGAKLLDASPLPVSGVLFLLLVLGSVSFDGLMRTFAWLGAIGINPLEFPGRSAVMLSNTLGLFFAAGLLAAAFFLCVWLGERMCREPVGLRRAVGLLVWSIAPIALAYHFAHYLISLLVNGQYALVAISDPFSLGWNLFGTADNYVSAGLVMGLQSAWVLWNLQAVAIVAGHVLAVLVAHILALRLHTDPTRAARSQIPLTVLMVCYTVLGLWLLSTPTGA